MPPGCCPVVLFMPVHPLITVSYTHLDVYKRQVLKSQSQNTHEYYYRCGVAKIRRNEHRDYAEEHFEHERAPSFIVEHLHERLAPGFFVVNGSRYGDQKDVNNVENAFHEDYWYEVWISGRHALLPSCENSYKLGGRKTYG